MYFINIKTMMTKEERREYYREYRKRPGVIEHERERQNARYANDPEFRAKRLLNCKKWRIEHPDRYQASVEAYWRRRLGMEEKK